MKLFLSCVSSEFRSYRLKLANQLGALQHQPYEVKVQEDFTQGGFTLLDKLAEYIRECDLVIHFVGDVCGARPSDEHVRALFAHLGLPALSPLPELSYTQCEYDLAQRFARPILCYIATETAPRDCGPAVQQPQADARLQRDHRARIEASGKQYETFSSHAELVRRVFYDLHLEADLKVNNLPYKSLGTLFKGREDFLAQLHNTLGTAEHLGHQRAAAITATATAAAVHGLGGIGKTRAAIEYALRYADEYTALLFVQADSPSSLQSNLASLCGPMVLDLAEKDARETEVQVAAVLDWLQRHPGWFLILDNVDTEEAATAVQALLARLTRAGQVVITSRLGNWEGAVETLALDVLTVEDAAAFLLERTEGGSNKQGGRRKQPDDAAQARVLAVELGQLALALEQAGAYISLYRSTFQEYLEEWRQRHDRVLEWFDERLMQYPRSVAATWQTSFDRLTDPARRLLRLLSWLAPDPIPESLLEAGGGPFAAGPEDDSISGEPAEAIPDARDALVELAKHSLVKRLDDEPAFTAHRLVQDVTRCRTKSEHQEARVVAEASRFLVNQGIAGAHFVDHLLEFKPLLPHAEAVWANVKGQAEDAVDLNFLDGLAKLAHWLGSGEKVTEYAEASLALRKMKRGEEHPDTLISMHELANAHYFVGNTSTAEALYRKCLALKEKVFGWEHRETLATAEALANAIDNSKPDEAISLMDRAIPVLERLSGPYDSDVSTSIMTLAQAYFAKGNMDKTISLLKDAVDRFEKSTNPESAIAGIARGNLAGKLHVAGRLMEADPFYRKALEIQERVLGKEQRDTRTTTNNYKKFLSRCSDRGWMLAKEGDTVESVALMRLACEGAVKLFGEQDSITQNYASRLASFNHGLAEMASTDLAEIESTRRKLEATDQASSEDKLQFALQLNLHALLLRKLKRYAEAAATLQSALDIEDEFLPPDHPKRAHRHNNMAIVQMLADRLDEAKRMNAEAWSLKASQHDVTSGRILFVRSALCMLRNEDSKLYTGQLRTLLAKPKIPCQGNITRQWDAADILDELRSRLTPEQADFLAALVAALNDPDKIADLERFDLWRSTQPVPLEAPWPNEPVSGNPPMPM
jgi:tetratricopeptide (TPR) repeat protein